MMVSTIQQIATNAYNNHKKSVREATLWALWLKSKKDVSVDEFQLIIDLHKSANRQGPGGDEETEKAIDLACIDRNASLKIADIGCGTGASTLVLARSLNAEITAVDLFQDFLDVLGPVHTIWIAPAGSHFCLQLGGRSEV
jgi:2-polyprenyl-3-methyl-5-hydroxy-6-metoxy-1,4-benzoquinol methylase